MAEATSRSFFTQRSVDRSVDACALRHAGEGRRAEERRPPDANGKAVSKSVAKTACYALFRAAVTFRRLGPGGPRPETKSPNAKGSRTGFPSPSRARRQPSAVCSAQVCGLRAPDSAPQSARERPRALRPTRPPALRRRAVPSSSGRRRGRARSGCSRKKTAALSRSRLGSLGIGTRTDDQSVNRSVVRWRSAELPYGGDGSGSRGAARWRRSCPVRLAESAHAALVDRGIRPGCARGSRRAARRPRSVCC